MFLGEAVLAEMYPYLITRLEHDWRLVDVELAGESVYLAFDRGACFFMHLLELGGSCACVHVCSFLKRQREDVKWRQRVEAVDNLEGGLAGCRVSCAVVGILGDG